MRFVEPKFQERFVWDRVSDPVVEKKCVIPSKSEGPRFLPAPSLAPLRAETEVPRFRSG
jgi:hypothetical protein